MSLPYSTERFSLGRLLAISGRTYVRDFAILMALAFVLRGAGLAAEGQLDAWMAADIARRPTAAIVPWLVGFFPFALADGAITWTAVRRLAGRTPTLGGLGGLARLVGAFLAIDLVENVPTVIRICIPPSWLIVPSAPWLGEAVDLAYPIIGGFWLALWLPALAVAVAEQGSGAASLGRSLDLTRGYRWALGVLCLGLQWLSTALALLAAVGLAKAGFGGAPGWWAEFVTLPVWAFSSVTQAAVYWELVRLKTGLSPAGDGSVFG